MAIIFERFFVFEIQGCIKCRKCRSIFMPCPDFPQNPFSTDFSRIINVITENEIEFFQQPVLSPALEQVLPKYFLDNLSNLDLPRIAITA